MKSVITHQAKVNDRSPDEHLADLASVCPDCRNVTRLHGALVEFGYETLTVRDVREAYEAALLRPVTPEDGIIALMVRSQLRDAGIPLPAEEARDA